MAIRAALGPYHHDQPALEQAVGLLADLAIVPPLIFDRQRQAGEQHRGVGKIEAALRERLGAFGGIVGGDVD